jgi:hypothetical protein
MIVAQPTFVGKTSGIGTSLITLAPIAGLVAGDFLIMFAGSNNASAWVAASASGAWTLISSGGVACNSFLQAAVYTRKWTGGEVASFWQVTPNGTDRTTVVVVAYRGCDASFQQYGNSPANGTSSTAANGLMTTNAASSLFNGVANAGTVVLFGLANRQDTCTGCNPPATSQAGAFTQREFIRGPVITGGSPTIYVGDSQLMPAGISNFSLPNGNGGWIVTSGSILTATWALVLVPPTITQVQNYAGNGQGIASGLPHASAWSNGNNVSSDNDVRATVTNNAIATDTDWLRAIQFGFAIPTTASIFGYQFVTRQRGWTPLAATNPPSADLTYCLTNASAQPDVPTTTQSHVQSVTGTKINSPTAANPADTAATYGGFLNYMNRSAIPLPADVNNANWGYCLLYTIVGDPGGSQSYNYEVDSMSMNLYVWNGTDITPPSGGPLLFCEA